MNDTPFKTPTTLPQHEMPGKRLGWEGRLLLAFGAMPLLFYPGILFAYAMTRRHVDPSRTPLDLVLLVYLYMSVLYPAVYGFCLLGVLVVRGRLRRRGIIVYSSVPLVYFGLAVLLLIILVGIGHVST